jgi:hypothetical protein
LARRNGSAMNCHNLLAGSGGFVMGRLDARRAKKIRKRAGPRGAGGRATPPDGSSPAQSLMGTTREQTFSRSVRRPGGAFGGKNRKPLVTTDGQVKVDLTSFNP